MLAFILWISILTPSYCFGVELASWYPPVDQNNFNTVMGINHDVIVFYDDELEYPYYMLISHTPDLVEELPDVHHLWKAKEFSWSSDNWILVSDTYQVQDSCGAYPDCFEYDDGIKVNGKYYIYENGVVYTYTGTLEEADGNWSAEGTWPHKVDGVATCDDAGIFYEDGVFHLFGEYGTYALPTDGVSLSHYTSTTGIGDWTLVSTTAVNPNITGEDYGVGDPTLYKVNGTYYLFCDRESVSLSERYKISLWVSNDINADFTFVNLPIIARTETTEYWDGVLNQDAEIVYMPEKKRFAIALHMDDNDGIPDKSEEADWGWITDDPPPQLRSRIIGTYYSTEHYKAIQGASFK